MPNESMSLYITVNSGSSERTLVTLADKTKALDKETQQLQQTTEGYAKANRALLTEQTRLQSELKSSQKTVNDLQKAYDEYGDELSKLNLDNAIQEHAKLKAELSSVNAQISTNQKTYKEHLETVRKGGLSGDGGGLGSSGISDVSKNRIYSELLKPMIGAWGAFGETLVASALGTDTGSLVSGVLSGAASGALAGAVTGQILGLPGAAVGAVLGGATGLISGGTKIFEAKDDAFKDYYSGLYDDVKGRSGEMVTAGSTIAGGREKDLISFKTMFGSEETAGKYLSSLVDMANTTPFLYDDLVSMSKTLATYGYNGKVGKADGKGGGEDENSILPLLRTIGDAGAALGMSTSDMNAVAQALGRMKSSNKATLEYLNILNDRGIGVFGMLAEAKGKDLGGIYDDISKGEITGGEAVKIITEALAQKPKDGGYLGAMEEQSATFEGISSTLEGMEQEFENSGGEAYNKQRMVGLEAQKTAYEGELGNALKEINAVLGENQAQKENMQDQYMRDVLRMVLTGKRGGTWYSLDADQQNELTALSRQYQAAKERYGDGKDVQAGAELEAIYETAQALGEAYFDNSEFMKTLNRTELDEIEAIRNATVALDRKSVV